MVEVHVRQHDVIQVGGADAELGEPGVQVLLLGHLTWSTVMPRSASSSMTSTGLELAPAQEA